MDVKYPDCGVLHQMAKKTTRFLKSAPCFSKCYKEGAVKLDPIKQPPNKLIELYSSQDPYAVQFHNNIRPYNLALLFTFIKYIPNSQVTDGIKPFQI